MPDDKTKTGGQDRIRIGTVEPYAWAASPGPPKLAPRREPIPLRNLVGSATGFGAKRLRAARRAGAARGSHGRAMCQQTLHAGCRELEAPWPQVVEQAITGG
jgi:hypothetical protein